MATGALSAENCLRAARIGSVAARSTTGFTTATELADTLVRHAGLGFRQAHRVASAVVQLSGADATKVTVELVGQAARQALGRDIQLDPEQLEAALDPWCFVEQQTIPGGPVTSIEERARVRGAGLASAGVASTFAPGLTLGWGLEGRGILTTSSTIPRCRR